METLQSLHTETELTGSTNNNDISDPQKIVSEPINKDTDTSLDINLQKNMNDFPNIGLLNQSRNHDPDNKPILSSNFSEQLLSVTESHDLDMLDDIPPLESIEEEVEDVGVLVTDIDLGAQRDLPGQKTDSTYTPLISDEHNETNVEISKSESVPILKQEDSDTIPQKDSSIITKDSNSSQKDIINTENTEETKNTAVDNEKIINNNDNINSVTPDSSNLSTTNTTADLKVPQENFDIKNSIDKHNQDDFQQPSNEIINKEHINDDIDMRMKQEDVEAMNLELPTNLGDDDFPKLYDFDTKEEEDIFSPHDILEGSIQTRREYNENSIQNMKESDLPELPSTTYNKLQDENKTDLSIFKYGLNTSLCLPETNDIKDKMDIEDTSLSDGQINNELNTPSTFTVEQASNISNTILPSLSPNEKLADSQSSTKENSLSLALMNNDASESKIGQENDQSKTVTKSDELLQELRDTFDKGENRNTPASIISKKNNLLYRKRKNSLIPGAFYPINSPGYTFNTIQSSDSNSNEINEGIRNDIPSENSLIVSNDSVNDTSIPKVMLNGRMKSEQPSEVAKEQPTVFAYARLDFQSYTFYVQTLHAVIGRRSENDTTHKVDVNLGPSKSISRRHAQIFYNFGTGRFELSIIGKNGAFVDDVFIERGNTVPLHNKTKIQIGQIPFQFVLPEKDNQTQEDNIPEDKKETKDTPKEQITKPSSESKPKSKPKTKSQNNIDTKPKEPKKKAAKTSKPVKKEPKEKEKKIPKPPKKVYTLEEIPVEYRTKPPFSYSAMLTTCIRKYSSEQGMSLSEIYGGIRELYPYYKYCPDGWQSSVRHNLSLNKSFRKVCKKGKGWLWGLDEAYIAEREKIKQKQAEAAKAKAQAAQLKLQQQNVEKGRVAVAHGKKQVKANISQTLSANRSGKNGALTLNRQSTPSENTKASDKQRTMKFLQDQLIIMTRDRKGLDKQTIATILTQALAMTINQVTQAAKSQGIKGNPLTALMDKNPQHLNLILSAAVNAATAKVTKGKVKQLVDPSILQQVNENLSTSGHSNIKKQKATPQAEKNTTHLKQNAPVTKSSSKSNSSNNTNKPNSTTTSSTASLTSSISTPSGGFDPTSLSRFFHPKNQNNRTVASSASSSANYNRHTNIISRAVSTSTKRPHENINSKESNKRLKLNYNSGDSNDSSDSDTSDTSDDSDTSDTSDSSADSSSDNDSDSSSSNDSDSESSDSDSTDAASNNKSVNDQEQKATIEQNNINKNNQVIKENINEGDNDNSNQHTVNVDSASDNTKQDHMLKDTNIESKDVELNEEDKNGYDENKQTTVNETSEYISERTNENESEHAEESSVNGHLNSEESKVETNQHTD